MRLLTNIPLTIVLLASITSQNCSRGALSGLSNEQEKNEKNIEQPQDVAGGFGLACDPFDNQSDPSKTDFNCYFIDQTGNVLATREDLTLVLTVKVGSQTVEVTRTDNGSFYFGFTTLDSDSDQVSIDAKFVNASDESKVISDKSASLSSIITKPIDRSSSTCETWSWKPTGVCGTTYCVMQDSCKNLQWSKMQATKTYSEAVTECATIPVRSKLKWRLPTVAELTAARDDGNMMEEFKPTWIYFKPGTTEKTVWASDQPGFFDFDNTQPPITQTPKRMLFFCVR